jgi:membrane protein YqaA with SNARE-associated domain
MDSLQLVEYMAWVPIVGSAFGNVLGGFVSDYLIGKQRAAEDDASALAAADDPTELLLSTEASSAAAARADAQGVESVKSTRRNSKDPSDQSVRMLIAGWSNLLPIPLITLSLLAPFPYCFLIMIASGMVRPCMG